MKVENQRIESTSMSNRSMRDGTVLGGREDVEDPAADGELAAVVDLVDALVARGDEVGGDLVEVEQVALADREAERAQLRVGDLLAQRDGTDDHDRGSLVAVPSSSASSAATRSPTRCGGGARCDS